MSKSQEWLMIDMHTHSEFSSLRKSNEQVKKMSASEFVETLVSYGINVFSITDHNYFANDYYDEICNYISSKKYNVSVINGVELDIHVDIPEDPDAFIHVCFYFDDNIDRKALHDSIEKLYSNATIEPSFQNVLKEFSKLNSKIITIPHGSKDRGLLNHYLIDKIVTSDRKEFYKYAMYKIFNAFDITPASFNNSEDHWALNFYKETQAFNKLVQDKNKDEIDQIQKDIIEHLKNGAVLTSEEKKIFLYAKSYGSIFAYFCFSDWHNANPYNPTINNFIFGSTDYAFSSFELATLDPLSRIQKTKEKSITISDSLIESVSFEINGNKKTVSFSPGLNAIVGKRGSGKSLLVSVLRNLAKSDDKNGAYALYKKLNISNISGKNRGGIDLSPGRLQSVEFLIQDEIRNIIEDPEKAQEKIKNKFPAIKDIDLSAIDEIKELCDLVKPINRDYKNITSELRSSNKIETFFLKNIVLIDSSQIETNYDISISSLNKIKIELLSKGFNTSSLNLIIENLEKDKRSTLVKIDFLNTIFTNHNKRVNQFNKELSANADNARQNSANLADALNLICNNFKIALHAKKLNYKIKNLSIKIQPASISLEGKYLFATYYDCTEDIKNKLSDAILEGLTYASDNLKLELNEYICGNEKRKLKSGYSSLGDGIRKLMNNGFLKSKQSFFEISNTTIDYKLVIKTYSDLMEQTKIGNLIDLNSASLGMKSVAYLNMLFELEDKILVFDQPEDNIDNDYISTNLVPIIKNNKMVKQLIFVTHNPSVAVFGDAFNYIYTENNGDITYKNFFIEDLDDKEKLLKILEGGRSSFSNRNKKFGDIIGEENYGN